MLGFVLIIVFALNLHLVPTSGWGKPEPVHPAGPHARPQPGGAAHPHHPRRACSTSAARTSCAPPAPRACREFLLVRRHLLKNALIPVVTVIGPILAFLIVGSLVVETIFSVPGIGRLLVQGISQRDYSLIMGTTLLYAFVIAALNLIVDILYAFIDPRISYR